MTKTTNLKNNNWTSPPNEVKPKELITLQGITTSQINQALKADNPYPARVFLKVDNQEQDIPVFFRIKDNSQWIRPKIKTGSFLEVAGNYNSSLKSHRPSFTAYQYQIIN